MPMPSQLFIHGVFLLQICLALDRDNFSLKMSNSEQAVGQLKLTTWEYQLIRTKLLGGGTPMTIASEIIAAVKRNFNIERTHQEILEAIQVFNQSLAKVPSPHNQAQLLQPLQVIEPVKQEIGKDQPQPILSDLNRRAKFAFSSRRKVALREQTESRCGWSLQNRLDELQKINDECTYAIEKYDKKLNKKISQKGSQGVNDSIECFYHEFFYSNYDKKFFRGSPLAAESEHEANPMKKVQEVILGTGAGSGLGAAGISYRQHKKVLGVLGRPRVFGQELIEEEKNSLECFRNICRQKSRNTSKTFEVNEFPINSVVLALHPMCGHLHTGSILAIYKENQYMVKFMKPELPTQKILDINMSTQFTENSECPPVNPYTFTGNNAGSKNSVPFAGNRDRHTLSTGGVNNENIHSEIVENLNFEITAFLIKLLSLKSSLVDLLRKANNAREQRQATMQVQRADGQYGVNGQHGVNGQMQEEKVKSEEQLVEGRWEVQQGEAAKEVQQGEAAKEVQQGEAAKQVQQGEGAKEVQRRCQQEKIAMWAGGVLSKMEPIIQQTIVRFRLRGINEANSQPFFSNLTNILVNPLKMMSKDLENSVDETEQGAAMKIKTILARERENQVSKAIRSSMQKLKNQEGVEGGDMPMIESCLGILLDLKLEGKSFDVQKNPNLLKLASLTEEGLTEGFNEFYERLYGILSRIKD